MDADFFRIIKMLKIYCNYPETLFNPKNQRPIFRGNFLVSFTRLKY